MDTSATWLPFSPEKAVLRRGGRRSLLAAGLAVVALSGCEALAPIPMEPGYPAIGRRLLAAFPNFSAELRIESSTSMSFVLKSAGGAARSETVKLGIRPVAEQVFLVTWQESNKTTVVQVHDFARKTIVTHVTRPDGTFFQAAGAFVVAD